MSGKDRYRSDSSRFYRSVSASCVLSGWVSSSSLKSGVARYARRARVKWFSETALAGQNLRVPTLTLFCGLPCSGKTTLATKLERAGRGIRLCTDDWQADLGISHCDEEFHNRLQPRLYRLALDLLARNVDVILEDGLWTRSERVQKLSDARSLKARVELHVFDLSFHELAARVRRRNDGASAGQVPITPEALESYWRVFQLPKEDELALFDDSTIYR